MTEKERTQADRKLDAEIAETLANQVKLSAESRKLDAELYNLNAGTRKTDKENDWYLLVVGSAATLAIVGFVKLFL